MFNGYINILIVDKCNDAKKAIEEVLKKSNMYKNVNVIVEESIDKILNIDPDLIFIRILDEDMIKKIRDYEKFKDTQIILITSEEQKGKIKELEKLNIDDFISYPYDEREIHLAIRRSVSYLISSNLAKNKDIEFNALLNSGSHIAWLTDKEGNYSDLNNYFIEHAGKTRGVKELKSSDTKVQIILDNIPFGVWLKDAEGIILNVNKKVLDDYNIEREDIIGLNELDFIEESRKKFIVNEDREVIEKRKSLIFEREELDKNGNKVINEIYKSPVFDVSGKIIGIVGLCRDITGLKRSQEQIKILAYSDYLTGVLNRRGLFKYIGKIQKEDNVLVTLMFVDLDNFKKLNDNFGHYYGDKALIKITNRLKEVCPNAKIARIGGDEFVIVWKNLNDIEIIESIANRILSELRLEFSKGDRSILISGSMGIVLGNMSKTNYEKLLVKGDAALYKAKDKGKNQYVFYTNSLERELNFNLQIEEDIKKAVTKDEILLKYQPQYSLDGEVVGFEALFRWNNPKYHHTPVIDIIKTIEKFQIMDYVGDYILKEAFKFAKEVNLKSKKDIVVSVNISALQIMGKMFVDKFKALLDEVGVDPKYIGIEITETVLLENIDENIVKIQELKDIGINVAIDDFGTGYSSLNYLVKLPISKLKIDKSFIDDINDSNEYKKLVNLIIEIAHSLSLEVVAEGVEDVNQLDILKNMDVNIFQGYLFSRPILKEKALQLV